VNIRFDSVVNKIKDKRNKTKGKSSRKENKLQDRERTLLWGGRGAKPEGIIGTKPGGR
jgi:hypothetical protein